MINIRQAKERKARKETRGFVWSSSRFFEFRKWTMKWYSESSKKEAAITSSSNLPLLLPLPPSSNHSLFTWYIIRISVFVPGFIVYEFGLWWSSCALILEFSWHLVTFFCRVILKCIIWVSLIIMLIRNLAFTWIKDMRGEVKLIMV